MNIINISVGSNVIIKENLCEELTKLDFMEETVDMMKELIGHTYEVFDIWEDEFNNNNQKYVTVDLCVEIPIQCLELVE